MSLETRSGKSKGMMLAFGRAFFCSITWERAPQGKIKPAANPNLPSSYKATETITGILPIWLQLILIIFLRPYFQRSLYSLLVLGIESHKSYVNVLSLRYSPNFFSLFSFRQALTKLFGLILNSSPSRPGRPWTYDWIFLLPFLRVTGI